MIDANPVTYDAPSPQTTSPAMAARAAASRPKLAEARAYSRPAADAEAATAQAEAVLKIVRKKLKKAHIRIDRQDARHQNLFFAYFELKERAEKGG